MKEVIVVCEPCETTKKVELPDMPESAEKNAAMLRAQSAGWEIRDGHLMCEECAEALPPWKTVYDSENRASAQQQHAQQHAHESRKGRYTRRMP